MRDLAKHPELCAINTATLGFQAPLTEVIDAVARAGFGGMAPWRRELEGQNARMLARYIRNAGLKVTGYCRSTYLPATDAQQFKANVHDNLAALETAAELGADYFALVVGSIPPGGKDISAARGQVAEGIALLLPAARTLGVRLALEPLHPVYAVDRSCINTLAQALDLCAAIEGDVAQPQLGLLVDAYHVWWDPNLARDIARAGTRIFGFHVSDWLVPVDDVLNDRGMMGDGVLDLPALRALVEAAGYQSFVEAEIFSTQNWWMRPMAETLSIARERFASCV